MTAANDNPGAPNPRGEDGRGHILFALISGALVIIAILAGLALIDPPWVSREQALDRNLTRSMVTIKRAIDARFKAEGALPAHLAELATQSQKPMMSVPASCLPGIEYEVIDPKGQDYKLCATFQRASTDTDPYADDGWKHAVGHTCFALKAPEK